MRIVLLGFGTVGQALAQMLREQRDVLAARLGTPPRLVAVTDSRGSAIDPHGLDEAVLLDAKAEKRSLSSLPSIGHTATSLRVVLSTAADVVVETTPSNLAMPRPALDHLLGAMRTRKHVVSVNKAPLAVAMPALLEAARHNRVGLAYSGTVGAATPFLHAAGRLAVGDRIVKVRAILNGTTNFILHRMFETDEPFDAALAEAVRLGYAETDPSNDIDGIDTAMKLVIMANHAARSAGQPAAVAYRDLRVEGIRGLPIQRVREARAAGKAIKLIATIDDAGVRVGPEEVEVTSPLNTPRNVNACTFSMAQAGEVTLVGRGAGGAETATAIVRDIIEVMAGPRTQ